MSDYEVELFSAEGFKRKKCPSCGKYFWTCGERESCGEPPCEEYSFIGDPATKRPYSLSEMREKYLSYFEKHGHTRIPRYPIIARWRSDIFFTIASISCFQPWVLNGTIEPPANPLVMSQTCVRFNDIDNVGKTGRHLTEFEMMAHHAFNTSKNQVYFKDRTVELCHNLLLDLGVSGEDVQYIEAEWAGGGNSGPCFEVIVRGVELATLVFMMYKDTPSGREEMEMQVVDTGYGLERFTWISQGTPNTYEAIFGSVLQKLKDQCGLEPDEEILGNYSRLAGMMNVESNADLRVLRSRLSERMGIPVDDIIKTVAPFEHLYSICDHTRSLMFMLNDGGIVPSNVKAGYFARLLARKSLRSLKALGLDMKLRDAVDMQIEYFKPDFPELSESKSDILELIDVEEGKYEKTVVRGRSIVEKIDSDVRKKDGGTIDTEDLISLYDSHGLTPELVSEFSDLKVDIPDDFYIKVAAKHERADEEEEKKEKIDVPQVEPTHAAYYEDAYVRDFKARVLKVFGSYIVLDKTYFYPEGGGQESDRGMIDRFEVVEVEKHGGVVVHKVKEDPSGLAEGSVVECCLDWDRRYQLMQHHTVTHVINGAARQVLGNHAWQSGAHKSEVLGRLDITHHSRISDSERGKIEELANKVVKEKRDIRISFMERGLAEREYGFRIYQGGAVPGKVLRIVDIRDWDVEACGGMHFKNTSEVGLIKITDCRRIQDGVVRLEYKAGRALDSHAERLKDLACKVGSGLSEEQLREVADIFSVQIDQLPKTIERFKKEWSVQAAAIDSLRESLVELTGESYESGYDSVPELESVESYRRLFSEWKMQKKDMERLQSRIMGSLADEIKERFRSDCVEKDGVKFARLLVRGMDVKNLSAMAKEVTEEDSVLIIANKSDGKANIVVCSKSLFDAGDIAKRFAGKIGGGAHGSPSLAVGGGSSSDLETILEDFKL